MDLGNKASSYEEPLNNTDGLRTKSSVFRPAPYYQPIPGMKTAVTNFKKSLFLDKVNNKLIY